MAELTVPIVVDWEGIKSYMEKHDIVEVVRWIPVTELLPELGEKVLVSTEETVFVQVFKGIYRTPNRWAWEHCTIKKVTAWMPLPEPWKGESDAEIH